MVSDLSVKVEVALKDDPIDDRRYTGAYLYHRLSCLSPDLIPSTQELKPWLREINIPSELYT